MYLSSSFVVKRSSLTEVRICTDRSLTFAEASAAWYMGRKTSLTNHLQQVLQRELIGLVKNRPEYVCLLWQLQVDSGARCQISVIIACIAAVSVTTQIKRPTSACTHQLYISTAGDVGILPPDYLKELQKLYNRIPAFGHHGRHACDVATAGIHS